MPAGSAGRYWKKQEKPGSDDVDPLGLPPNSGFRVNELEPNSTTGQLKEQFNNGTLYSAEDSKLEQAAAPLAASAERMWNNLSEAVAPDRKLLQRTAEVCVLAGGGVPVDVCEVFCRDPFAIV